MPLIVYLFDARTVIHVENIRDSVEIYIAGPAAIFLYTVYVC